MRPRTRWSFRRIRRRPDAEVEPAIGCCAAFGDFHAVTPQSLGAAAGPIETDHAESRLRETPRHGLPHASQA
jgi:hypothetical protein